MKRLVGQLEKTRSDLNMQLHEAQGKLDKEGIDYHHFDDFYKDYKSQILNLNRTIDLLVRSGTIPASYVYELHAMHSEVSDLGAIDLVFTQPRALLKCGAQYIGLCSKIITCKGVGGQKVSETCMRNRSSLISIYTQDKT